MSAITRGSTARAAVLVHAGSRRAFSLGVTRPRTTGVCSRTSSDSKATIAKNYPSSSRLLGCSNVVPVSWKMNARSYATEGSAPPADKVRQGTLKAFTTADLARDYCSTDILLLFISFSNLLQCQNRRKPLCLAHLYTTFTWSTAQS